MVVRRARCVMHDACPDYCSLNVIKLVRLPRHSRRFLAGIQWLDIESCPAVLWMPDRSTRA